MGLGGNGGSFPEVGMSFAMILGCCMMRMDVISGSLGGFLVKFLCCRRIFGGKNVDSGCMGLVGGDYGCC
jgi:hypothetical protein